MLGKTVIILVAALSCMLLLWILREFMLTPVKAGRNTQQMIFLSVRGREPALENNLGGLLWLHRNRILRCRIIVAGYDLDEETRFVAEAMERDFDCITFIENGELPEWIRKMNC